MEFETPYLTVEEQNYQFRLFGLICVFVGFVALGIAIIAYSISGT